MVLPTSGQSTTSSNAIVEKILKVVVSWLDGYNPKVSKTEGTVVEWRDPEHGKFRALIYSTHVALWWVTKEPSATRAFNYGKNPSVQRVDATRVTIASLDKAYAKLS